MKMVQIMIGIVVTLDQLELNATNEYCGETSIEKLVGYFSNEQINTNAPRKYLECIYLNEKNC